MKKALRIVSTVDGFRRGGMAHSKEAVIHPDGTFNAAQVKALKAEPTLIVDEIEEKAEPKAPAKPAVGKSGPTKAGGKTTGGKPTNETSPATPAKDDDNK